MRKRDGRIVYSPSDLVRFAGSPFASWMDRYDLERPDDVERDDQDETMAVLARRGDLHEAELVVTMREEGRDVVEIPDGGDRFAATRVEIDARREVICQAALTDGVFAGYADFLVLDSSSGRYEVWDAKLARSSRPTHLLQLCCYADMLDAMTGERVETIVVALGSGEHERFRRSDFRWYADSVRVAFLKLMETFDADADAPEPRPGDDFGDWSSHADEWFEERDHLCRVAGMRSSQIGCLDDAGITTLTALATTDAESVRGVGADVFARLREQARLQIASADRATPEYRVIAPDPDRPRAGLALLPPASPMDVFLDLEGFPLVEDGLEYLIGAVVAESGAAEFHTWWAHDAAQERVAFEGAMDFLTERWRADRSMRIYHYAAYEVTAFRRLAGKYGTREDELDVLLRAEAFVDLYTVIRQGLRVGAPSYSLKYVERLYRGARDGEVVNAAASIVEYERWLKSGEPQDVAASPILAAIRDYNRDDCESTWELALWLRERQVAEGISYLPSGDDDDPERPLSEDSQRRLDLSRAMIAEIDGIEDDDDRVVHELLAFLLEFHRREQKPQWWSLFDRVERSHEELVEDAECLGDLRSVGDVSTIKRSFGVTYRFDPDQEHKLDEGDAVQLVPLVDVSATVHAMDRERGVVELKIGPSGWRLLGGQAPERVSLVKFKIVAAKAMQAAIEEVASAWRDTRELPGALRDLLGRCPTVEGHTTGPLLADDEDVVAGTSRVAAALQDSCLVIQGPPGAGKTHTAARVILALLAAGKSVGVTSNSHRAIENLLAKCDEEHAGSLAFMKVGGDTDSPLLADCDDCTHPSSAAARGRFKGGLIGGTAWLFARAEWVGALDYLFIDEAGQVSLANVVAMSRATLNLVLMGDQMQLAQPIQGTHPGDSGLSALDYYLEDHVTIPGDLGVFLPQTWRMHPDLCEIVSDAIYEGRLLPAPHTKDRVVRVPDDGRLVRKEAGLIFLPVEHAGNVQASDEEVGVIEQVVAELLGREITAERGLPSRTLALKDILFVAPYNMQVRRLRDALPDGARVGSVDKFQGQEAAVVVLSMCASPGEFGSRGSAFLLYAQAWNMRRSAAQGSRGGPRGPEELRIFKARRGTQAGCRSRDTGSAPDLDRPPLRARPPWSSGPPRGSDASSSDSRGRARARSRRGRLLLEGDASPSCDEWCVVRCGAPPARGSAS